MQSNSKHPPDDDECDLGRHNCVPPYECFNTKGSFRCRQRSRYAPVVSKVTKPPIPSTTTSIMPSTTARPIYYTHTVRSPPYQPPVYQTSNQEYNRYVGSCGIGFERNSLGACVGKFSVLFINHTIHVSTNFV